MIQYVPDRHAVSAGVEVEVVYLFLSTLSFKLQTPLQREEAQQQFARRQEEDDAAAVWGKSLRSMRCMGSASICCLSSPLNDAFLPPQNTYRKHDGSSEDPSPFTNPPTPCFKWRLVIAYDGTKFSGWQYQQSPPTIQCTVEKALTRATKLERKELCLVGASRTDAGVHAWGQVAHFVTPFSYDSLDHIHAALNGLLPSDIRVREISPAKPEFHARFSTKSKIYHYKIYSDTFMDPFQRLVAYHCSYRLNAVAMREAAKYFVGKHNFSAFANAQHNDRVINPVKHIIRFDVIEMGSLLQLEVEGSGFLYRQVRNMVALLVQIGKEAIPPDIVPQIMASQDRKELAKYAFESPPHGLCLMSIKYNEDHLEPPLGGPAISFGRHHTITKCKLPFY